MDSSPFVEQPKRYINDPHTDANSLRFQVTDLENQLSLERLQHEEELESLRKDILALQKKSDDLAADQVYYYEANKESQGKLQHVQQNYQKERDNYNEQISQLKSEVNKYRDLYDNLKASNSQAVSTFQERNSSLRADLDNTRSMYEDLMNELQQRSADLVNVKKTMSEKDEEIALLQLRLQNMPSEEDIRNAETISKSLSDQVEYIKELEHKNLQQSEELKSLRLNKTNTEILKSLNESLKTKLAKTDELNDIINSLNMEVLQLKQENSKWKIYLDEDDDVKIEEFVREFKTLKDESLIVKANFIRVEAELKEYKHRYNELFIQHESLQKNFKAVSKTSETLSKLNAELEQQRDLAFEESSFLREQLKSLDSEMALNQNDKDTYIANLESVMNEYKAKIESMTNQRPAETSNKRQRTDEDDEETTRTFQKNITSLEDANFDLKTQITRVMNENALLIKKLESIQDIKEQKMRILQLRNNPFMQDQLIKKEQLEVLKRENTDLLQGTTFTETIPKSVYESLQLSNKELETKIYELNKRIQRLREIFSSKSNEFVEAIYSVIGYKIEFQKTGKITLRSKFSPDDSIVVDPSNVTLKKMAATTSFTEIWEKLIDFWIREKENLPCFLAALTLELYDAQEHLKVRS